MPFSKLLKCQNTSQSLAWWKQVFGRDFPAVHPFLEPCIGQRASVYPCPDDPAVSMEVRESGTAYRAVPTGEFADDFDDVELCWEEVQAYRLDRSACEAKGILTDDNETAETDTVALISESCEKISRQMTEGFESVKSERIEECVRLDTRQKVIEEIAEGPEKFIAGLRAQLSGKEADLFSLLIHKEPDDSGSMQVLSYTEIGQRLQKPVSKQAVGARYKKLEENHPEVWAYVDAIRNPVKETVFSGISPSERDKYGIDKTYNYDAG
jgi:hypothetical protein